MLNLEGGSFCNDYLSSSGKYKKDYSGIHCVRIIKNSFVFAVMDVKKYDNVFS